MNSIYVVNRRIDPQSDIGDIKVALQFTPIYCVLISSIYDMQLAHQFAEIPDILQGIGLADDIILAIAREYSEKSDMAVLIVGEADRLAEVKEDGSKEELCSYNLIAANSEMGV
jgi:hypothetical protein